jgi:predicted RNA-binding protein with PUA-like domain
MQVDAASKNSASSSQIPQHANEHWKQETPQVAQSSTIAQAAALLQLRHHNQRYAAAVFNPEHMRLSATPSPAAAAATPPRPLASTKSTTPHHTRP